MRILVDTNVFARVVQPAHRHHVPAQQALVHLRMTGHQLCTVPQILYEFWAISTRPPAENGLGRTVPETVVTLAEIKALFRLFRDERAVYQTWERLVEVHDVKGKNAHDARLVAAMRRHGLTHILTFNREDFARYPDISVLTPPEVLPAPEKRSS